MADGIRITRDGINAFLATLLHDLPGHYALLHTGGDKEEWQIMDVRAVGGPICASGINAIDALRSFERKHPACLLYDGGDSE